MSVDEIIIFQQNYSLIFLEIGILGIEIKESLKE